MASWGIDEAKIPEKGVLEERPVNWEQTVEEWAKQPMLREPVKVNYSDNNHVNVLCLGALLHELGTVTPWTAQCRGLYDVMRTKLLKGNPSQILGKVGSFRLTGDRKLKWLSWLGVADEKVKATPEQTAMAMGALGLPTGYDQFLEDYFYQTQLDREMQIPGFSPVVIPNLLAAEPIKRLYSTIPWLNSNMEKDEYTCSGIKALVVHPRFELEEAVAFFAARLGARAVRGARVIRIVRP